MFFTKILLLSLCYLSLALLGTGRSLQNEVVKVSVYYESLCPYSKEFIADHLYPGYLQLQDSLLIDLVPYGFTFPSQVDGEWQFQCQHGPNECHGNRIHGCVVANENLTQDQVVNFVGCMMQSADPSSDAIGEECASQNNISWTEINECVQSSRGDEVVFHFGDISDALNPPLEYVPNIRFNNVFDEGLENGARGDFVATACSLFNVKPSGCQV